MMYTVTVLVNGIVDMEIEADSIDDARKKATETYADKLELGQLEPCNGEAIIVYNDQGETVWED